MGRQFIIKRSKKTTTLEEYHTERNKNKTRLPEEKKKTPQFEEAVSVRYRYKRHN